jgi:class 3 adenylate cyclase
MEAAGVGERGQGKVAELVVLNGTNAGTVFVLLEIPTVVGRSEESHLLILDPWISSMHAMFEKRGNEIWVVDLDSRNGTFLGDERITEARITDGAVVRFGRTEVRVDLRKKGRAAPPTDPPRPAREPHRDTLRADNTLSTRAPMHAAEVPPETEAPAAGLAARRATVLRMAVDAAGIDGLSGAPERLRSALDAAARSAAEAGAAVARLAGIGVLAVFGAEGGSPEDAARAVSAALAARREVRAQGGLDLRAAVETGLVLTVKGAAGEPLELIALGPAAELSERLVALAGRGEILAGPFAGPAAGLARVGLRTVGELEIEVFRADG